MLYAYVGRSFSTIVKQRPLGFGELNVDVPTHICLFYSDDNELRQRLEFLALALNDPNEVAVLFGGRPRLDEILGYLAKDHGRNTSADLKEGRIVLIEGDPDVAKILPKIAAVLDAAVARGAKLIRFLGFIGWGDAAWPSNVDLLEFEAKVNAAVLNYPAIIVCTYNTTQLPGSVLIFGGIETHPITILGTTLCRNPHYVPYDQYLDRRRAYEVDPSVRRKGLGKVTVEPLSKKGGPRPASAVVAPAGRKVSRSR